MINQEDPNLDDPKVVEELVKKDEDFMASWKKREEYLATHPIAKFLDDTWNFFRYRIKNTISDAYYVLRNAHYRAVRGYDDPMVFSFCHEHAKMTIDVLKHLRRTKIGSPWVTDPDDVLTNKLKSEDDMSNIHERYDEMLGIIIDGFQAMIDMDDVHVEIDGKYDHAETMRQQEELFKKWKKGMVLFTENYRGLWD